MKNEKKTVKSDKTRKKRHIIRKMLAIFGVVILFIVVSTIGFGAYYFNKLSNQAQQLQIKLPTTSLSRNTTILDANNKPLQQGKNILLFEPVKLSGEKKNVSDLYSKTLVAVEDDTFYTRKTQGFSISGMASAGYTYIKDKLKKTGGVRGGSTIDQQLVKNIALGGANAEETLQRKAVELIDARSLASRYSREEILSAYINSLRLYPDTMGVNAAYFNIFGEKLPTEDKYDAQSLNKLAYIVGMGQSPSIYFQQFETYGKQRTKVVLGVMLEKGLITQEQYDAAIKNLPEFKLKNTTVNGISKDYQAYIAEVNSELSSLSLPSNSDVVIKTYATKEQLEELSAIANGTAPSQRPVPNDEIPQGCLTAISAVDTKTGHILGIATNSDNPLIPISAERSSGSSIKPLIDYAPALEFGAMTTNSKLNGNATTYSDGTPLNNYGNFNYGQVTAGYALGNSLNTAAYQAFMMTSTSQKNQIMKPLGISSPNYLESDSIGYNISTLQEASAFTAIGNDGVRVVPTSISSIKVNGKEFPLQKQESVRAMSSTTARSLQQLMQNVTQPNGSEPNAAMPQWNNAYAVKSGLVGFDEDKTNEINSRVGAAVMPSSDAWLAATSTGVTVSAWIGTPDLSGSTYIVGGGAYPENNGRVYLLNNTMLTMNANRNVTPFVFTGQKLQQKKSLSDLPEKVKNISKAELARGYKYNPTMPSVPKDKQEWYDKNSNKRVFESN